MNDEESTMDEMPSSEMEEAPKEPSRLGKLFTKLVRWAAGIAVIFVSGVVLTWLIRVAPLARDLRSIREDLTAASAQIADLELAVSDYEDLEQSNADLQNEVESAEQHLNLMRILSDIATARIALANDNPLAARTALSDTDERMSGLQEALEGEDANTVVQLRVRLQQAISEIDTNAFAADGDLSILSNDLRTLENRVFNN